MFDPTETTPFTRRVFLQRGLTFASLAATAPLFIERTARGMLLPAGAMVSSQAGVPEDHILVVVQLGGGNDGLNTVVPYGAAEYHRARPVIGIAGPGQSTQGRLSALEFDQKAGIGLHPAMRGFKELLDEGVASVVQGVGYPNPNRSHFTSMDIWHTADTTATGSGWLGKYFDCQCNGRPDSHAGVAIGRETPLAMMGETQRPITFESADMFRWIGKDLHKSLDKPYEEINRAGTLENVDDDSQLGFLMRTSLDAQVSSDRIRAAVAKPPLARYPGGQLSQQLQIVGAMIRDNMSTRVYYVTQGGYDTHANQFGSHQTLLQQLGDSLNAFHKDLKAQGNSGRVLTMVFSEFGRRVAQNGSGGTDHGCAAPMYFVGDMIKPGLLGDHPSLTDLDQGDLKYNVDFRSIYAGVLEDWMKAPSAKILGGDFQPAKLLV
jgi:uncharacterized protein (DUF1501 family)